jgi:hypothetical protein
MPEQSDQFYLQKLFIEGGVGRYQSSISSGSLPPGLTLSARPPFLDHGRAAQERQLRLHGYGYR